MLLNYITRILHYYVRLHAKYRSLMYEFPTIPYHNNILHEHNRFRFVFCFLYVRQTPQTIIDLFVSVNVIIHDTHCAIVKSRAFEKRVLVFIHLNYLLNWTQYVLILEKIYT